MTCIASLKHSTDCPKCGEQSIAPEKAKYVSTTEIHHFWCCWNCGYEFETLEHLQVQDYPPSELVRKSVPISLAA